MLERENGRLSETHLGLCNLEISDLDATRRKVGNLKLDLDGPLGALAADASHAAAKAARHAAAVLVVAPHAGEAELGAHEELLVASKLLNLPDDGALLGGVVHGADVGSEPGRVGVVGDGDDDLDVVGGAAALELGLGLEHVLDARARVRLDQALDPDQGLDLGVEAVRHELELAVGGDERDCAVVFEAREAHALVELDVFHLNGLAARGPAGRLKHDLVVEAQSQLGHAAEVALHLDGAEDLAPQHVSVGTDQEVQALDNVQEDLVLAVADALRSPGHGIGDGDGRARLDLELVRLLRDVLLQNLGFGGLGVAKVHHLVEKLVDDDKVVADGFLLQRLEVLGEDFDDLV